jgi:hypothetical protein
MGKKSLELLCFDETVVPARALRKASSAPRHTRSALPPAGRALWRRSHRPAPSCCRRTSSAPALAPRGCTRFPG